MFLMLLSLHQIHLFSELDLRECAWCMKSLWDAAVGEQRIHWHTLRTTWNVLFIASQLSDDLNSNDFIYILLSFFSFLFICFLLFFLFLFHCIIFVLSFLSFLSFYSFFFSIPSFFFVSFLIILLSFPSFLLFLSFPFFFFPFFLYFFPSIFILFFSFFLSFSLYIYHLINHCGGHQCYFLSVLQPPSSHFVAVSFIACEVTSIFSHAVHPSLGFALSVEESSSNEIQSSLRDFKFLELCIWRTIFSDVRPYSLV